MRRELPVAVVGVGYLGRFHAQKYLALPGCRLVGVVDTDPERAREVGRELGVPAHTGLDAVLPHVEAVSVAVPTAAHHAVALRCLRAGRHALVEKPLAATVDEADELVQAAREAGVLLQVGYLERFNPAFEAVREGLRRVQFVESIRIAPFVRRGADVDVVLDLMSHDLDLALSVVPAPVRSVHAVGVSLLTRRTDLANARVVFDNGCVANFTASRISAKAERTVRLFQHDRYVALDLATPAARVYDRDAAAPGGMTEQRLHVEKGDALLSEVGAFVETVRSGGSARVSGEAALATMRLARQIGTQIAHNPLP